jgi:hypothetical protein
MLEILDVALGAGRAALGTGCCALPAFAFIAANFAWTSARFAASCASMILGSTYKVPKAKAMVDKSIQKSYILFAAHDQEKVKDP